MAGPRSGRVPRGLPDALVLVWLVALALVFTWRASPWIALGVLLVAAAISSAVLRARTLRARRGWWVELLTPAILRGEEHELALIYHEGARELVFEGERRKPAAPDVIRIPSAAAWSASVPAWAGARREELLERVRSDPVARRCELVEVEADAGALETA